MKFCKTKLLSHLLVIIMILSVMPVTIFATAKPTAVSTEADLVAAIKSISEGDSGEITIQNIYMCLNSGIQIKNKDITLNLVNAHLSTATNENGSGQPVIWGVNANITINADENSSMQTYGQTEDGVVRIDNNTYDDTTSSYKQNYILTINGGTYTRAEGGNLFVVASGTEAVISDVVCNGKVEAVKGEGITVPGKITINGGKFSNNVEQYVADGKYFCNYGENYYVRDKEFSDDFSKPLTDGKIIFNYARPSADEEAVWLIAEDFCIANPDFYFSAENFKEDFSKLELGIYCGTEKEEFHIVDVVWDYDETVLQTAQSFIQKFPEDRSWFNVSDLELVNYWVYHNPDSEVDSLANYSGELKSILGNSNFLFNVEIRGGSDELFYTERIGSAKLIHNDKVYFSSGYLGARAEHAIYVPENTDNTKEALIAAAQKRIDNYIGENIVRITAANETVTKYYNNELAEYDSELAAAQSELEAAQATLDTEQAKDPSLWNLDLITQCNFTIMNCEWDIQNIPQYKMNFIERFDEGGDLHFLKNAAGDFMFNVEVIGKEESYKFVIIKDDTKLTVPSYATVDLNTNVSITTQSSTVPLDTVIEVDKLTGGADYNRIIEILDIKENETFDIKLHSGSLDDYVTKLDDSKFEVKIPIPQKFEGKTLTVYYVDQNNKPIEYEVAVKDHFAVFTTDHFSIYTLAEKADNATEHTQHNGGTATCCTKAICTDCNQPYGELNPANHSGGTEIRNAKKATEKEDGYTGDTYCKGCGEKIADGKVIPATGTVSSPQTGDNSNLRFWLALAFVSGGLLLGTSILRKRKKMYEK